MRCAFRLSSIFVRNSRKKVGAKGLSVSNRRPKVEECERIASRKQKIGLGNNNVGVMVSSIGATATRRISTMVGTRCTSTWNGSLL